MQDGTIALESTVGKGSVFKIEIPYRLPTAREIEEFHVQSPGPVADLTGLKVLLAEDNTLNQRLVERILTDVGMTVDIAGTGKAAVEMLTAKEYDFVLMDMQMPVMDGYEAASIMRNEMKSDVPIIAMTAHAMQGEKEKCLRLGMNDYIPKPIKTKELYEKLSRIRGIEIHAADMSGSDGDGAASASIAPDFTYLMEATGGNSEFIVELLSMCMRSIPEDVNLLGKAVEDMDLPQVKYYAHKMRSSTSLTGVRQLTDHLKMMELISIGEGEPAGALSQLMRETETLAAYALQVIETEIAKRNTVAG
jgi:CheY-like chemotaxis protein